MFEFVKVQGQEVPAESIVGTHMVISVWVDLTWPARLLVDTSDYLEGDNVVECAMRDAVGILTDMGVPGDRLTAADPRKTAKAQREYNERQA